MIFSIFEPWDSNMRVENFGEIPKIDDFLVLRSIRSLNINNYATNIIFYCRIDIVFIFEFSSDTLWGGWMGGRHVCEICAGRNIFA